MSHGGMNMDPNTTMAMTMAMMMGNSSMDPHAGHHGTTKDPHAGHHGTTKDPHAGHGTTMDPHAGHGAAGHEMKMYFHDGTSEYILFQGLHTSSVGGFVGACFVIFALAVLYEGLKFWREYLLRRASLSARQETYAPSTAANGGVVTKQPEVGTRMLSGSHAIQTILHMVQVFVSYCLMLVFMTFNVYLCVAIIVGAGVGYFLFGWRRAMVVDMNEHCH